MSKDAVCKYLLKFCLCSLFESSCKLLMFNQSLTCNLFVFSWGRGAIHTKGVCNLGKLNYYLGAQVMNTNFYQHPLIIILIFINRP